MFSPSGAGLAGVRSETLMREFVQVEGRTLILGDDELELDAIDRITVVGAGKAGAGMAATFEDILGDALLHEKQVRGFVNVPADCVRPLKRITLHAARPAGVNEPTAEGVIGAETILKLVGECGPRDLCVALISGGGSALLPCPVPQITLADKLAVTRFLSAAGADITELNTVRKHLSRIKGGGLARACRAGRLITLVLSDVLGDPLDLIGSGPTVPDTSTAGDALAILEKHDAAAHGISANVLDYLRREARSPSLDRRTPPAEIHVIGNNATAVDCAGIEAEKLGYSHAMICANGPEGGVEAIGRRLAELAVQMRDRKGPDCLIMGGEGTVKLAAADIRGRGGRNQQTVLAALLELVDDGAHGIALLSAGTDGEDGPTDAAGAWLDAEVVARVKTLGLDPHDALRRNDAYLFFANTESLILTGPTHTNVCDLRILVVSRVELERRPTTL
ncbi:MAG: DUF4147 domain-containing protein [Pirellulales bacterium]